MNSETLRAIGWAIVAVVCGAGIWMHGDWVTFAVTLAFALAAWQLLALALDLFYPSNFDDDDLT